MEYIVTYVGSGSGYNEGQKISIPDNIKGIKSIANYVNSKANLTVIDIGYLSGNKNKMRFGTHMDGITFKTVVLEISLIKNQ
jgi:hypothetical protein